VSSFVPRCLGECGSQKCTPMPVAALQLTRAAIYLHWFHVIDRRRCSGSSKIFKAIASRAVCALRSLNRGTRSATCWRVPRSHATYEFPPLPRIRSPSLWPGTSRSVTSAGPSESDTMSFSFPRAPLPGLGPLRRRQARPVRSAPVICLQAATALRIERLADRLVRHPRVWPIRMLEAQPVRVSFAGSAATADDAPPHGRLGVTWYCLRGTEPTTAMTHPRKDVPVTTSVQLSS